MPSAAPGGARPPRDASQRSADRVARPRPQAFFEPIGVSPEVHGTSRRWVVALVAILVVGVAGILIALRWNGWLG